LIPKLAGVDALIPVASRWKSPSGASFFGECRDETFAFRPPPCLTGIPTGNHIVGLTDWT
jgi:hypothetical protein